MWCGSWLWSLISAYYSPMNSLSLKTNRNLLRCSKKQMAPVLLEAPRGNKLISWFYWFHWFHWFQMISSDFTWFQVTFSDFAGFYPNSRLVSFDLKIAWNHWKSSEIMWNHLKSFEINEISEINKIMKSVCSLLELPVKLVPFVFITS